MVLSTIPMYRIVIMLRVQVHVRTCIHAYTHTYMHTHTGARAPKSKMHVCTFINKHTSLRSFYANIYINMPSFHHTRWW
jgi:hypothetical protein